MFLSLSIVCGLAAMLSFGSVDAYMKPLAQRLGAARLIFLRGLVVVVILLIAAAAAGARTNDFVALCATLLLGIAGYIPVLAFTHAVKNCRLGIVAPIAGTAPLFTVVLAWTFLNVPLHFLQGLAIFLVILANLVVSVDFKNWRESTALQLSSGIPFALLASLGWGLFYFFLIPATHVLGPWLSACLTELGVTAAAGFHARMMDKNLALKEVANPTVVLNAVLLCLGTIAFTVGVNNFDVGIVAALANSTALVSAGFGCIVFKEHLHAKEKLAAAAMIAGIAILSLGQTP